MTYPYPPPNVLEAAMISKEAVMIVLWCVVITVPGSIAVLWYFKPRSRRTWIAAEILWGFSLLMFMGSCLGSRAPAPYSDLPWGFAYLAIATFVVVAVLPFPAMIAGLNELIASRVPNDGFRDLATWGCATPFGLFLSFLFISVSVIPTGHPAWTYYASQCKFKLKQLGLVLYNYQEQHGKFPDAQFQADGFPARSWRVEMLPFVDQKAAFESYDQTQPWNSEKNLPLAKQELQPYSCPAVPVDDRKDARGQWFSAYAALNGPHAAFPNGKGLSIKEISDGLSNTTLIVESCGQQIVWTEPRDVTPSSENLGINLPGSERGKSPAVWSSYHRPGKKGAHTLLGDGSVRFLSAETDPRVLRAITTANGGESIGEF